MKRSDFIIARTVYKKIQSLLLQRSWGQDQELSSEFVSESQCSGWLALTVQWIVNG